MRVLIADDDPVSRRFLERILAKWGYEAVCVEDGDEAWAVLASDDPPRLALFDWMMPGMEGTELCRALRADTNRPYTYVVLVTARDSRQDSLDGFGAGADEYLTKPIDLDQLEVRLRAGRRIVELQEQLIAAREALRYQAEHDQLTGLPSRAHMTVLLENELDRSKRMRTPVAVLMCDVDHFKNVNDTWGHAIGDAVLRGIAARLRGGCRRYDTVGRFGGEEFMAVLPGCTGETAADVAERLRVAVASKPLHTSAGDIAMAVSIGVASSEINGWTSAPIVHAADVALYAAKRGGRNRVERAPADVPPLAASPPSDDSAPATPAAAVAPPAKTEEPRR